MDELQPMEPIQAEPFKLNDIELGAIKLDPLARYLIVLNDNEHFITLEDLEKAKALLANEGIRAVVIVGDLKVYELAAEA